jgi:hypothetical protein
MDDTGHRRRTIRRWRCICGRRFPCGAYLRAQSGHRIPGGRIPDGQTVAAWRGVSIRVASRR